MVKQVRVIQNTVIMAILFSGVLWFVGGDILKNLDALIWGLLCGALYGAFYWFRLVHRIARRERRYERNKVFVQFISPFEIVLLTAASSHFLLIGMAVFLIPGLIFDWIVGHWWAVLLGSGGVSGSLFLGTNVLRYEHKHGPVYYQYDSRGWSGEEGLLYQTGEVVEPLSPRGRILINGELWNAVSMSGEPIDRGEQIEIISREGLTLHVDRVSTARE